MLTIDTLAAVLMIVVSHEVFKHSMCLTIGTLAVLKIVVSHEVFKHSMCLAAILMLTIDTPLPYS